MYNLIYDKENSRGGKYVCNSGEIPRGCILEPCMLLLCMYGNMYFVRKCSFFTFRVQKHLPERELSYIEPEEVLYKHQSVLAERKAALKKAESELTKDLKKISKGLKEARDITVMENVHLSLKEVRTDTYICVLVFVYIYFHVQITTHL